ncbi:hypothetical protein [Acetobacterium wieringae]|uniref:hypothetical protein n=1 Tax=Acetobacterium wieringae TaxID=52694 RepID=UPI0031582AD4
MQLFKNPHGASGYCRPYYAHFDHLGGAFLFDEVNLSKQEATTLQMYFDKEIRGSVINDARKKNYSAYLEFV